MDEGGWGAIPSDTLVGILLRLLPTPRRRLRLVCRHWRHVIDDRMPAARQARAKVLAFSADQGSSSGRPRAYVLDGLIEGRSSELELPGTALPAPPPRRRRSPWLDHDESDQGTRIVGTCNGLICLCLGRGDIFLFNPVTGEELVVPPPPPQPLPRPAAGGSYHDDDATHGFCFTYHPETGMYKILRVPRHPNETFDAVHVFTLGEAAPWREVPAPGSSCRFEFGIVAVRGVAYWVSKDAKRVVSFDLGGERAAVVAKLPVHVPSEPWLRRRYTCSLADVGGRLGFTVCHNEAMTSKTEVFVLEERMTWIRQYVVLMNDDQEQQLASPLLAHGEHLLTEKRVRVTGDRPERMVAALYAHRPREDRALRCGVVPVAARSIGTAVLGVCDCSGLQTFPYVETTESLLVYTVAMAAARLLA
ncbi:unnamed protein product [Urochloa decumbens]|uniref:F-box domain-containing protein n=1 Tax=Urochloa decumbens TaxID=240449 RepID=A0ABC9BRY6_9POAL